MYYSRSSSTTWRWPRDNRRLFDISKAFDNVWHEGLLFKLKQNGLSGNLSNVITDVLYQRKQRVFLNGQHSSWTNTKAENHQESILGPLFFLIHINDLSGYLSISISAWLQILNYLWMTPLFSVAHNINSAANDLNSDLINISN